MATSFYQMANAWYGYDGDFMPAWQPYCGADSYAYGRSTSAYPPDLANVVPSTFDEQAPAWSLPWDCQDDGVGVGSYMAMSSQNDSREVIVLSSDDDVPVEPTPFDPTQYYEVVSAGDDMTNFGTLQAPCAQPSFPSTSAPLPLFAPHCPAPLTSPLAAPLFANAAVANDDAVSRKRKKTKSKPPEEVPDPKKSKPVSSYALFFQDKQAAIKAQNPNVSFGEISKIVANMWENLDLSRKQEYKRQTTQQRRNCLTEAALSKVASLCDAEPTGRKSRSSSCSGDEACQGVGESLATAAAKAAPLCQRVGCEQPGVSHPHDRWLPGEFCSTKCNFVCGKDAFAAFVARRKTQLVASAPSASGR